VDGMRQILWGFFKKIVVADNCAKYVNQVFAGYETLPGSALALGAVFFAFQIYGDFSGYSDIAVGTSRLLGFNSMQNFRVPYFSRDIAEFWRRWHMSLTGWFREYLYVPLGGNRGARRQVVRNTFIVFLVCGLWHGANWTFIAWGFINALYFLPLLLLGKNRKNLDTVAHGRMLPGMREIFQMGLTFALTVLAWIFFRADNIRQAFSYIRNIFRGSLFTLPLNPDVILILPLILVMTAVEWLQRDKLHGLEDLRLLPAFRWAAYLLICILCLAYSRQNQQFIYFQF